MRLRFEQIPYLLVTEEKLDAGFHHFLEDKVLIIVANVIDISVY
jgi:hypothetical protein